MPTEKIQLFRVDTVRAIGVGTIVPLLHIHVPRRAIGRVRRVNVNGTATQRTTGIGDANVDVILWMLLVSTIVPASITFNQATLQLQRPMLADIAATKGIGTLTTAVTPMPSVRLEGDFDKNTVRGSVINNVSGPPTNVSKGWTVLAANPDLNLEIDLDQVSIIEVDLEWPPSRTAFFQREHVANEENQ